MSYLLVFDSVSSGTKTCLYTVEGVLIAQVLVPLTVTSQEPCIQQDAYDWWNSLVRRTASNQWHRYKSNLRHFLYCTVHVLPLRR